MKDSFCLNKAKMIEKTDPCMGAGNESNAGAYCRIDWRKLDWITTAAQNKKPRLQPIVVAFFHLETN